MSYLAYLASCFLLGALHALEPGHGKAVVGAYLVGARGRRLDAVILGLVVTLTHTAGVVALALLATFAAASFAPEAVVTWLELGAGALVLGVGAWLLWSRLQIPRLRSGQARVPGHSHVASGHEHPHSHPKRHSLLLGRWPLALAAVGAHGEHHDLYEHAAPSASLGTGPA